MLILVLGYISIPYYKAYKAGVSVKYFKDSRYCEVDSDCVFVCNHNSLNKYNYIVDSISACNDVIIDYFPACEDNSCKYKLKSNEGELE